MLCRYISLEYLACSVTEAMSRSIVLPVLESHVFSLRRSQKNLCNGSKSATRKVIFFFTKFYVLPYFLEWLSEFLLKILFFKGKENCSNENHNAVF